MSRRRACSADSRSFHPVITLQPDTDNAGDDVMQLSSPSSSSSSSPSLMLPPAPDLTHGVGIDDLSRDLAVLAELRENVERNLRLRPIRSFSMLPKLASHTEYAMSSHTPHRGSPSSSSTSSSVYHSPVDPVPPSLPSGPLLRCSQPPSALSASVWDPGLLNDRLSLLKRPLLLDTRPFSVYQACHFSGSFNIAIPSLILKRYRKPGGGFHSLDDIRQFITSEDAKQNWDVQSVSREDRWDGHIVIVYGEETDESEKENLQVTAWALLSVLSTLLDPHHVHYLKGGMVAARQDSLLRNHIISRDIHEIGVAGPSLMSVKGKGVFQLNTALSTGGASGHSLVESQTLDSPDAPNLSPPTLPLRQLSESTQCVQHQAPPRLQVHIQSTHAAVPPISPSPRSAGMNQHLFLSPQSPSHLTLLHSNHSSPASSPWWVCSHSELHPPPPSMFSQTGSPPHTPDTPLPSLPVCSPSTARPSPAGPLSTGSDESEEILSFTVSTILPGFLYLGPELTLPVHVTELKTLGIRRILNIAAECDADDYGLNLRHEFERYVRVPMRDTVEEEKVRTCLRVVCEILDDAALYDVPTYVHCKAGRSRSVAAVMAYLIHAHRWPLSRAYTFVVGRRRGVSPNIGFVSELMAFEARELGGRPGGLGVGADDDEQNGQGRRLAHARESLPPLSCQESEEEGDAGLSLGQDREVKDAEGRWRHVRRAPVDETTLQPMRRVSKAGLESTGTTSEPAQCNDSDKL